MPSLLPGKRCWKSLVQTSCSNLIGIAAVIHMMLSESSIPIAGFVGIIAETLVHIHAMCLQGSWRYDTGWENVIWCCHTVFEHTLVSAESPLTDIVVEIFLYAASFCHGVSSECVKLRLLESCTGMLILQWNIHCWHLLFRRTGVTIASSITGASPPELSSDVKVCSFNFWNKDGGTSIVSSPGLLRVPCQATAVSLA